MKPIKIGLDISVLNDENKTGIANFAYGLIEAMIKADSKSEFVLFGISTFANFERLNNIEFKKYPNVKLKIIKWPSRLFSKSFLIWQKLNYPKIEKFVGQVDIFHSFNWYMPPQSQGKMVSTVYDLTAILYPKFHHQNTITLEKQRLKFINQNAHLVVAISENTKKDMLKLYPKAKVEVIYPAVDPRFNAKKLDNEIETLKKYNLKPGYILSVATLEPRKNLLTLIKAYLEANLDNDLVLVGGSGWKSNEILNLVKKNHKIKLTGFVDNKDLPTLYRNSMFFVYPSFYEGFGIPVLEAMSCMIPVITSNTSSLPEVGGSAAIYIDPNSQSDLKNSLIKLAKDSKLRNELARKAKTQAQKFSWDKSAKKMLKLYLNLAS